MTMPRGYGPRPPLPMMMQQQQQGGITTRQLKEYRDAQPWIYYDTRMFSANTVAPDTAAFNFAQCTSPLAFFNQRTIGNATLQLTNMSDNQKTDNDFVCSAITIDVFCDMDSPSAPGISTTTAFVEIITHHTIVVISFGTDVRFVCPTAKLPCGGGMVSDAKIRTTALPVNSDSAQANNGLQTRQAVNQLGEEILFKEGTAFTTQILFDTAAALARLQALQALTGNFQALIRVNLEGVRGKGLVKSSPNY